MPVLPEIDAVLRLSLPCVSRERIEKALGVTLFRFHPQRSGSGHYAQVNFGAGDDWDVIATSLERIGPAIKLALDRGEILSAELDVGYFLSDDRPMGSLRVPRRICEGLSRVGVELLVSVYVGSSEEAKR